jgi:hypothetical protein
MTTKCIKFGDLTAKNINVAGFRDANWSPKKTLMLTLPCLLMRSICSWKTVKIVIPMCLIQDTIYLQSCAAQVPYLERGGAVAWGTVLQAGRLQAWSPIFFFQCHHMSLMDFVVSPPCCGRRVTDVWGWDAHEAQLRFPDEVVDDIWIWSTRRGLKPKFY